MLVDGKPYTTIWMEHKKIKMINQCVLPHRFEIVEITSSKNLAKAIKNMIIRGAPALGAAGAYGVALAAINGENIEDAANLLKSTRPTAYDLFHGIDFVLQAFESGGTKASIEAAETYANQSIEACRRIGETGSKLLKDGYSVLTHCNAGWLACVDWGTALSPVYFAKREGKRIRVFVDETRPVLQGARLTAWELANEGIENYVIPDNAAGYFIAKGEIDAVIVGADRIAMNGDIANKIGTYEKAVLAKEHGIPFYVAAPTSTIDSRCAMGEDIPIEQRNEDEVHYIQGIDDGGEQKRVRITHRETKAKNPAFDITPAKLITTIITERGMFNPKDIGKALKIINF